MMRKLVLFPLIAALAGCCTSHPHSSPAAPATTIKADAMAMPATTPPAVPYSITLQGFSIAGFPGVHSAVVAGTPDQLVVLGGRRNGLHGFPAGKTAAAGPSFPQTEANDTVYVLDLVHQKLLGSAAVSSLPVKIGNHLKSTNVQYQLLNGWLYLMGGYGPDPQLGTLTTLDFATVIDFAALVSTITANQPLDAAFAAADVIQFEHPALALTGGDLDLLPDPSGATDFVLAFGQNYNGQYTVGGGLVQQIYADGVRIFRFTYPTGSAKPSQITFVAAIPDPTRGQMTAENPFHRRDYTLRASLDSSGNRRLAAYGGVFKGGRIEGFLNPVFVSPGPRKDTVTLTPNGTIQALSQYDTAAIQLFDGTAKIMYTTFFGGISQYSWDAATNSLKHDALDLANGVDGLPFINSVSTLAMPTATDTGNQYLHVGQTFPPYGAIPNCSGTAAPYGGAEAAFVIAAGTPTATAGVLQLNGITSTSVIGYFLGGIAASDPYPSAKGTSCASNTIYTVTLNPSQPTNTVLLTIP
jgi:hypothetical protein